MRAASGHRKLGVWARCGWIFFRVAKGLGQSVQVWGARICPCLSLQGSRDSQLQHPQQWDKFVRLNFSDLCQSQRKHKPFKQQSSETNTWSESLLYKWCQKRVSQDLLFASIIQHSMLTVETIQSGLWLGRFQRADMHMSMLQCAASADTLPSTLLQKGAGDAPSQWGTHVYLKKMLSLIFLHTEDLWDQKVRVFISTVAWEEIPHWMCTRASRCNHSD